MDEMVPMRTVHDAFNTNEMRAFKNEICQHRGDCLRVKADYGLSASAASPTISPDYGV